MNNFISDAIYMQETYPNEFKEAIKAFKNKMKQSAKERYYPEKHLYKIVNTLGNKEKISIIKGLNKKGVPYDVIMRIMGGMSKYSGKITNKEERMKHYKMVERGLRMNERNEIIKEAIQKAKEKGLEKMYQKSEESQKKLRNKLNKLQRDIRLYERRTNWRMKEDLGNKKQIKEEYIEKKMKYLKELKEIGKKIKKDKERFIKDAKIYGEQNENLIREYMNNEWIYNPMKYSMDFLVYYLFHKNITNMNINYLENMNNNLEKYNENKIKNMVENEFNNLYNNY